MAPEDWEPHDIDDLEEAAWDALFADSSAVAAGPGAGKTEFLAQRASFLLETGKCRAPQQILAISFKRDAARNLRERLNDRVPEQIDRFASMTFDSFTKSLVDRFYTLLPPAWAMNGEYRIAFPTGREVQGFLTDTARTAPTEFRDEVLAMPPAKFLNDVVGPTPLLAEPEEPATGGEYAVSEWWRQKYLGDGTPTVDFIMLNRLAELIVRSSPQLRKALRVTYPYVFVDEFQDTTYAQYTFLASVFPPESTIVTVVGDDKQRIMGWAGALPNAFAQFATNYSNLRFELEQNFRSRQELVDLQHRFARRLNTSALPQMSQVVSVDDGVAPVQAWDFSSSAQEARTVAAWVAADIEGSGRAPSQYALIARQRVAALEPEFAAAFEEQGLSVRNDDATIGVLKLGDILKDDLVELLIGLVRLGASRGGQPEAWRSVTSALTRARPDNSIREVGSRMDDELSEFLTSLRAWLAATPLTDLSSDRSARIASVDDLTQQLAEFLHLDEAAGKRVLADRAEDIEERLDAFKIRLSWAIEHVEEWGDVSGAFLDENAVPLMTIHRSKGLEYHTVFFIGLDGDQWWAHQRDTLESTMAFFVGMSRAAERLIFTSCDERGSRSRIADLYRELTAAGVPSVRMG